MKSTLRLIRRQSKSAPVTFAVLAALIGIYLLQILVDNRSLDTQRHGSFLVQWGANVSGLTTSGEWWRLVTSMFLHGGLLHVAFNSSALFELGKEIESRLGSWRFAFLYLFSGLGGAVASMLWHVNAVSVGASGAIFGIFGAAFVFAWKKPSLFDRFDAKRVLAFIVFSLLLGWFMDFDNAAHIGGLLAGMYLACSLLGKDEPGKKVWLNRSFGFGMVALAAVLWLLCQQVYNPQRAVRVQIGHLVNVLDFTLSSDRSVLSGCAYEKLENYDDTAGSLEQRLSSCASHPRTRKLLQIWVNNQWPRCFAASDRLIDGLSDLNQRKAVMVVRDYCEAQQHLDRLMLKRKVRPMTEDELKASIAQYSWMVSGLSYYRNGAKPDREDRLGYALFKMLKMENAEAKRLADLSSCPRLTCYRPWVQELLD